MQRLVFLFVWWIGVCATLASVSVSPAQAQEPACGIPVKISQDIYVSSLRPPVSGDYVVWVGDDGNDDEIYLYQISTDTITNISQNDGYDDDTPHIDGDYVVWVGDDGNDDEIYLYQISTDTTTNISQNDGYTDRYPRIDGDYVTWSGYDGNDLEIYLYQISTSTLHGNISQSDGIQDLAANLDGDYVGWTGNAGGNYEVFLYRISDSTLIGNISNDPDDDYFAEISGDYLVWVSNDSLDFGIYLYRISDNTPLGNISQPTSSSNEAPHIDGDYVVWPGSSGGFDEIFLYQISTGTTTNISQHDDHTDFWPQIDGDYVVWEYYTGSNWEIYLYQISTAEMIGNISQSPSTYDTSSWIDGNHVTWSVADSGHGFDVYLYTICLPATEPTPAPIAAPAITDPALSKIGTLAPGQLGLPGEQITWTITAIAPNADLTNVVISDTFPAALQIENVTTTSGTATVNGQTLTVTIPFMAAGSTVTIQVTTTVLSSPAGGVFVNTATLNADGGIAISATATVSGVSSLPSTGYPPH